MVTVRFWQESVVTVTSTMVFAAPQRKGEKGEEGENGVS